MLYAMPKAQYRMVRLRRPDVLRAQKMLAQLGGTYLTDFFHIASFMTAEEFMELSGKAGTGRCTSGNGGAMPARFLSDPRS